MHEDKMGVGPDAVRSGQSMGQTQEGGRQRMSYDAVRDALHLGSGRAAEMVEKSEKDQLKERINNQLAAKLEKVRTGMTQTQAYLRPGRNFTYESDQPGAVEHYQNLANAEKALLSLQKGAVGHLPEHELGMLLRALEEENVGELVRLSSKGAEKQQWAEVGEKQALSEYGGGSTPRGDRPVDEAYTARQHMFAVVEAHKKSLQAIAERFAREINERLDKVDKAGSGILGSKTKAIEEFKKFLADYKGVMEQDLYDKEKEVTSAIRAKIDEIVENANYNLKKRVAADERLMSDEARQKAIQAMQARYRYIPPGKQYDQLREMGEIVAQARDVGGLNRASERIHATFKKLGVKEEDLGV